MSMIRSFTIAVVAGVTGAVIGTVLGFQNGVQYQRDKMLKDRNDAVDLQPHGTTQTINLDSEFED